MAFIERYLLLGIAIASLVGGAYVYVSWQNSKIEVLTKDNVVLRETAEQNALALEQLQSRIEDQLRLNRELSQSLEKSENTRQEMLRIFRDHDLTKLATQKPGLIERRINDGTRKAFDDLESVTSN